MDSMSTPLASGPPAAEAVIIDADSLPALFDALHGRGYTVFGPSSTRCAPAQKADPPSASAPPSRPPTDAASSFARR
jgi:hypothetical protein